MANVVQELDKKKYTDRELAQLKQAVPLWRMAQERLPGLQKRGDEYWARCPLGSHEDKTPSFSIYAKEGVWLYHCYGCEAQGNVFQFVQKLDNIGFQEAVEKVAVSAGWIKGKEIFSASFQEVVPQDKEAITWPLVSIREAEQSLATSREALQWLASRGITLDTARRFHLGFVKSAKAVSPNHPWVDQGWIIFPTIEGETITCLKYRSIKGKKTEDGQPGFLRKKGMATGMFGLDMVEPFDDIFVTEGECLTGDTEILTPAGWLRLDQYAGQNVAQWSEGGNAEFVKPQAYIKKDFNGDLIHFYSKSGVVDLLATPDHNILYHNPYGKTHVKKAKDIAERSGFYRTAILDNGLGIPLSDDELRLQIAIQADGSQNGFAHSPGQTDGWVFGFKKQRKIERLENLLNVLNIKFSKKVTPHQTRFAFRTEPKKYTKVFSTAMYSMNLAQRKLFISEIPLWDGSDSGRAVMYRTIVEANADLVQWAYHMSGLSAKKGTHYRPNKHPMFWICFCHRKGRGTHEKTSTHIQKKTIPFKGRVYCVQVPSSFIIVRRNGVVTVTGNCDALVMNQAGYIATSLPSAQFSPTGEMRDKIIQANSIYLAGDMDVPGRAAMNKLWTEFKERTYLLEWPNGCKDANETFLTVCGGDSEKFRSLVENLKNKARNTPMPGLFDLQGSIHAAQHDVNPMDDPNRLRFPWANIDSWTPIVPGDVMCMFATESKTGKTTWLMNVLLYNAIKYNKVVVNYSAELSPPQYARRVVSCLTAQDRMSLTKENFMAASGLLKEARFYNGYKPGSNWRDVIELLQWSKRRVGADILVIDHLHFLTRSERDEIKAQSEAMRAFKDLAIEYKTIVIVVGQPRKTDQKYRGREAVTQDAKGSEAYGSDASQVFILHRDRTSTAVDDDNAAIFEPITKVKLDYSRESETRMTKLFFQGNLCRFVPYERTPGDENDN